MIIVYLDSLSKEVAETCVILIGELMSMGVLSIDPATFVNHVMVHLDTVEDNNLAIFGLSPNANMNLLLKLLNSLRAFSLKPEIILINRDIYERSKNARVPGTDLMHNVAILDETNHFKMVYSALMKCVQYVRSKTKPSRRLDLFIEDVMSLERTKDLIDTSASLFNEIRSILNSNNPLVVTPSTRLFAKLLEMERGRDVIEYYEISKINKEVSRMLDVLTVTSEEHWVKEIAIFANRFVSLNVDPLVAPLYLIRLYLYLEHVDGSSE